MSVPKIKLVMICSFSSKEIRKHLPLDKRRLYRFARKCLGMPKKEGMYRDVGLWNVSLINLFKQQDNIELHVVAAHTGMKKRVVNYDEEGVHYSFVKADIGTMLKHIIKNDALWRKVNPVSTTIGKITRKLSPDIVMLVGAENAFLSSSVLKISGYPIYVLCQTIYNNPERAIFSTVDSKNATTEMEIFKKEQYFGVYCKKHYNLLHSFAPNVNIFKFGFPSAKKLLEPISCNKEYDFVNFAREVSELKGYTDTIEATAIIKKKHPSIKVNLIGAMDSEIEKEFKELVKKNGVEDNITFTPSFKKITDLFIQVQKSRFAVLPCKMDNTSATMHQSMQLGLPLVVYETSGTPIFNKEKECVLIAPLNNVNKLAQHMLTLLEDEEKANVLKKNAREFQEQQLIEKSHNGDRLLNNLYSILDHYNNKIEIPVEQLFNPEKDD